MNLRQKLKTAVVTRFLAYDAADLKCFLARIGVRPGDSLMLHSSWQALNGFKGTPAQFNTALREQLGPEGLLVMPSLTYHNQSSAEYLAGGKPMDVRRSPSAIGLLTEVFRLGNSRLTHIRATDLLAGAEYLAKHGDHFFDTPAEPPSALQ